MREAEPSAHVVDQAVHEPHVDQEGLTKQQVAPELMSCDDELDPGHAVPPHVVEHVRVRVSVPV